MLCKNLSIARCALIPSCALVAASEGRGLGRGGDAALIGVKVLDVGIGSHDCLGSKRLVKRTSANNELKFAAAALRCCDCAPLLTGWVVKEKLPYIGGVFEDPLTGVSGAVCAPLTCSMYGESFFVALLDQKLLGCAFLRLLMPVDGTSPFIGLVEASESSELVLL